jgi:FlaA1/EpsC-like NDP-sugar epimerase
MEDTSMKVSSKSLSIIIIGIIVLLVAFSLYFMLDVERTQIPNWAFSITVCAIVVYFFGLFAATSTSRMFRDALAKAGFITILTLYFITVVISMLIAARLVKELNTLFIIAIIIHATAAILLTLTAHASSWLLGSAKRKSLESDMINQGASRIHALLADHQDTSYSPLLNSVFEMFKYGSASSLTRYDANIIDAIKALESSCSIQDSGESVITEKITQLKNLMEKRNFEIQQERRGGI